MEPADSPVVVKGAVYVAVMGASGLHAKARGREVFAVVGLSEKLLLQTEKVVSDAPVWTRKGVVHPDSPFEEVQVSVWAKQDDGFDVFLGRCIIPLLSLADGAELTTCFPLSARKSDPPSLGLTGEVQVRLLFKFPDAWGPVYQGVAAYENGDFRVAVSNFSTALQLFPEQHMLYSFRSAAYADLNQFPAAFSDANRVIELQPNRAEGYLRLGNVLVAADDFSKAKEAYTTALKLEPDHELTQAALRDMDRVRKLSMLRRTVERGRKAFDERSFLEAAAAFTEAIALNPTNVSYLVYRTLAYMSCGDARAYGDAGAIVHTDNKYPMEQPICMSMMQKQGKGPVGTWKSRFFVLKERFLWYYKDRKDLFPIDVVLLHKFTVKAHAKVDTRLALATDHSRTYNLKCESKSERDHWVDVLGAISSQPITLPNYEQEKLLYFHGTGAAAPTAVDGKLVMTNLKHTGFLWKAGRINTAPKLRWFVLKDHVLYYFRKQETSKEASYYGSIRLQGAQLNATTPLEFALILPDRVWNLRADAAKEAAQWTLLLRAETLGQVTHYERDAPVEDENVARLKSRFRATLAAKDFEALKLGAALSGGALMSSTGLHEDGPVVARPAAAMLSASLMENSASAKAQVRGASPSFGSASGFNDMLPDNEAPSWATRQPDRAPKVVATSAQSAEQRYYSRLGLPVPSSDDDSLRPVLSAVEDDEPSDAETAYLLPSTPKQRRGVDAPLPDRPVLNEAPYREDDAHTEEECCSCCCVS